MYREYIPEGRRIWNYVRANQVPTILSLLTPEHQERLVQQLYHEGVNAAHQWNASYCRAWPGGSLTMTMKRVTAAPARCTAAAARSTAAAAWILSAGDRGEAGLYRCPADGVPEPGMDCDSVQGSQSFGPGKIPEDTAYINIYGEAIEPDSRHAPAGS